MKNGVPRQNYVKAFEEKLRMNVNLFVEQSVEKLMELK